jgi:hypothetical protein
VGVTETGEEARAALRDGVEARAALRDGVEARAALQRCRRYAA